MFQKFFTDTLMSRFIKNLLSKESIPLLNFVTDGDKLIAGCLYMYKHHVIKCIKSGELFFEDKLPPIGCTCSPITDPDKNSDYATFEIIAHYGEDSAQNFSYSYKSLVHWYDSDTHKHLGEYLRFLRDYRNLNLMPFYNCYTAEEFDDIRLAVPTLTELYPRNDLYPQPDLYPGILQFSNTATLDRNYFFGSDDMYRVVAVPVKFGRKYTIAVECPTPVSMRCVIHSKSGMVKIPNTEEKYYSDWLNYSYLVQTRTRFCEPFVYSVDYIQGDADIVDEQNKLLYDRERDLYLLIQLPISNNSSIVVLEGDYTKLSEIITDGSDASVRQYAIYPNLSLLQMNTRESYAFSDRLVEYLLTNVITHLDEFPSNIRGVQTAIGQLDSSYKSLSDSNHISYGIWDDKIQHAVLRIVEEYSSKIYFRDQDGFINKDIEDLLLRRGKYRL